MLLEEFALPLVFAAGIVAGTINAIVGSGTLITFPILLAVGYPPVVANVSNTVGLVAGGFSGIYGYRRELVGQGRRALRFSLMSLLGGTTGALLLLVLPPAAFRAIVPALILVALVLVIVQPRLARALARRKGARAPHGGWLALLAIYGSGVYGGYFGAAQGVLVLGILGLSLDDNLQRINGLRNVLTTLVNLVAAIIFVLIAPVAWLPALLLAAGSVLGGLLGASVGRRLAPRVLRAVIVTVGTIALVRLLFG